MRTKVTVMQLCISLLPLVYLLVEWDQLPSKVPIHYNSQGIPDDFSSRWSLAGILLFMTGVGTGVSVLIRDLGRIDPKNRYTAAHPLPRRISWLIVLFICAISLFIVYSTLQYVGGGETMSQRTVTVFVFALMAALGNMMHSLKPNYFIGIRTPWSLEDDENWRMTHQFGSKFMFFGGILLMVAALFVPGRLAGGLLIAGVLLLALVPSIYSYSIYRKKLKGGAG
jgi:uncharacterized membrane protein